MHDLSPIQHGSCTYYESAKYVRNTAACVFLHLQVIDASGGVQWQDIAGLETVKHLIKEIVVWPMLNPHLFTVSLAVLNDDWEYVLLTMLLPALARDML